MLATSLTSGRLLRQLLSPPNTNLLTSQSRLFQTCPPLFKQQKPAKQQQQQQQQQQHSQQQQSFPKDAVSESLHEETETEEYDEDNYDDIEDFSLSPQLRKDIRDQFISRSIFGIKAEYLEEQAQREGEHQLAITLKSVAKTAKVQAHGLIDLLAEYENEDIVGGGNVGEIGDGVERLIELEKKNVEEGYVGCVKRAGEEERQDVVGVWEELSAVGQKNVDALKRARDNMHLQEFVDEDEDDEEVMDDEEFEEMKDEPVKK